MLVLVLNGDNDLLIPTSHSRTRSSSSTQEQDMASCIRVPIWVAKHIHLFLDDHQHQDVKQNCRMRNREGKRLVKMHEVCVRPWIACVAS